MKKLLTTSILAAAVALTAQTASARNITLCGASPGGLWTLIGVGLDAAVRAEDPNSTVTYQTSSGGFANIAQLAAGTCDLAIAHVGEATIALKGEAPFQSPMTGFGAVSLLYDKAPMHFLITKKMADQYHLSSIADFKDQKVPLNLISNRKGIMPAVLLEKSLDDVGETYKKIDSDGGSIQFEGSGGAQKIMSDGRADMWVNATFVGTSAVQEIAQARDVTLLSVPDKVIEDMHKEYGAQPVTIKAGAYPWLDHDVKTFGARAALFASKTADPKMIALVARAIHDHPEKIAEVHKAMSGFTAQFAASLDAVPYLPEVNKIYGE